MKTYMFSFSAKWHLFLELGTFIFGFGVELGNGVILFSFGPFILAYMWENQDKK